MLVFNKFFYIIFSFSKSLNMNKIESFLSNNSSDRSNFIFLIFLSLLSTTMLVVAYSGRNSFLIFNKEGKILFLCGVFATCFLFSRSLRYIKLERLSESLSWFFGVMVFLTGIMANIFVK